MSGEQKQKIANANRGKKRTPEQIKRLSEAHKGNIPTNLEQLRLYRKGRPLTEEHKQRIAAPQVGVPKSEETRERMSKARLGKPAWNKGMKGFMAGEKNSRWIKDRSKIVPRENRMDANYQWWRKQVRNRDGHKCKLAGKDCKGQLEVHHILSYKHHPERRYDIDNGITLCHFHHPIKKTLCEEMIPTFQKIIAT